MSTIITASSGRATKASSLWFTLAIVLAGSSFLALMARLSVPLPFTPVPLTMQTFAIFLLAGFLGGNRAALCVIAYLIEAAFGLPVLAGGMVDPFWFVGSRVGYLVGFVVAAYLVGKLLEMRSGGSYGSLVAVLGLGESIIFLFGMGGLSYWLGSIYQAFILGVAPFLIGEIIKVMAAGALLQGFRLVKKSIFNH